MTSNIKYLEENTGVNWEEDCPEENYYEYHTNDRRFKAKFYHYGGITLLDSHIENYQEQVVTLEYIKSFYA